MHVAARLAHARHLYDLLGLCRISNLDVAPVRCCMHAMHMLFRMCRPLQAPPSCRNPNVDMHTAMMSPLYPVTEDGYPNWSSEGRNEQRKGLQM